MVHAMTPTPSQPEHPRTGHADASQPDASPAGASARYRTPSLRRYGSMTATTQGRGSASMYDFMGTMRRM